MTNHAVAQVALRFGVTVNGAQKIAYAIQSKIRKEEISPSRTYVRDGKKVAEYDVEIAGQAARVIYSDRKFITAYARDDSDIDLHSLPYSIRNIQT